MFIKVLEYIVAIFSIILMINTIYQVIIGIHYFKKSNKLNSSGDNRKYAIFIAARNEASVIANLIKSLQNLNYPKDKYEIIVAPNNCTDNTKEVAIKSGARIFDVKGVIKTKGDVLHQMFNYFIENEDHDAYIVFDADNIVDENFIYEMNKVIDYGYSAAQGFKDVKNPYESMTSGCYTIYHYMINSFYNRPRNTLKINNMIMGSGFMATREIVNKLGGWNTKTITEDIEFTILTTLEDEKIAFCEDAIFYDEQPNSFITSWHQRIRWQTGIKQGFIINAGKIIKKAIKNKKIKIMDTFTILSATYISSLGLFTMILACVLLGLKTTYTLGLTLFGINVLGMILGPSLFAILILVINKRPILPMWKGILGYGLFLASWVPINIYVMFNKDVEWKEIKHDSKVNENLNIK